MNNRTDHTTSLFIDAIIRACAERGTTEIACILCGHGVPLAVALRVLTRPSERRQKKTVAISRI